jgi:hypothetical protein
MLCLVIFVSAFCSNNGINIYYRHVYWDEGKQQFRGRYEISAAEIAEINCYGFKYDQNNALTQITYIRNGIVNICKFDLSAFYGMARMEIKWTGKDEKLVFLNEKGRHVLNEEGVYAYKLKHNSKGDVISRLNLDSLDNYIPDKFGYAAYTYKDSDSSIEIFGHINAADLIGDTNKRPFETVKYDEKGNIIYKRYFDGSEYGSCCQILKYDSDGNCVETEFKKVNDSDSLDFPPVTKYIYDSYGYMKEAHSFLSDRQYIPDTGSPSPIQKYVYDEQGNLTKIYFCDSDSKANMRSSYDPNGNIVEVAFYDHEGNLRVNSKKGWALSRIYYDRENYDTLVSYFDEHEKPMNNLLSGIASMRIYYAKDTVIYKYFDADGKLSDKNKYGCAYYKFFRNIEQEIIEYRYYDSTGRPINITDGYAIVKVKMGPFRLPAEARYYDVNEKPVESVEKIAILRWIRDDHGKFIKKVGINLEGNVVFEKNTD